MAKHDKPTTATDDTVPMTPIDDPLERLEQRVSVEADATVIALQAIDARVAELQQRVDTLERSLVEFGQAVDDRMVALERGTVSRRESTARVVPSPEFLATARKMRADEVRAIQAELEPAELAALRAGVSTTSPHIGKLRALQLVTFEGERTELGASVCAEL